jgi:dTDP-4-dehydrorhamnose 3,5-epimerase
MKFTPLPLDGAYRVDLQPYHDERGFFSRLLCQKALEEIDHRQPFVQINHSKNLQKGVLRGLHYQRAPKAEIKIVKCIRGAIFDVIVDIREGLSTFLQWHGEILSAEKMSVLYIPAGFAHGYQSLKADCEILYFVTEYHSPEHEGTIRYNDPRIGIEWPLKVTIISDKDRQCDFLSKNFRGIPI